MTIRPLPDFLKKGDKALDFPHPSPDRRMRAMMGMAEPEVPDLPCPRAGNKRG